MTYNVFSGTLNAAQSTRPIHFAANALQCIVNGKEKLQNCPFPLDFVTMPGEGRSTAIGNMQREIGKARACGSGDILADRQTDRHTDRRAHRNTSPPLPLAK